MTDYVPKGKGMFVWKLKDIPGVNINDRATWPAAVLKAQDAGITHVIIKVSNGRWLYNMRWDAAKFAWVDDILPDTTAGPGWVSLFHEHGIQVIGWQWVLWSSNSPPLSEAKAILARVDQLGLDGICVNAEAPAKNKPSHTAIYVDELSRRAVPAWLCSYRYPDVHPELDWPRWGQLDGFMPQVYWALASNSAQQLQTSYEQYAERYGDDMTFIPVGAAFSEWGWAAKPAEVLAFMQHARGVLELPSVSFYRWQHAVMVGLWPTISEFPWPVDEPPPPPATLLEWSHAVDDWARAPTTPYDGPEPPPL